MYWPHYIIFSIIMSKNFKKSKKCPSQVPKTQDGVFKLCLQHSVHYQIRFQQILTFEILTFEKLEPVFRIFA